MKTATESAIEYLEAESLYGCDPQRRAEAKASLVALRTREEGPAAKPQHAYVRVNRASRHALARLGR